MNVRDYATGNFLQPEDVEKGEAIEITSEGEVNEDTPFGREVFEIGVKLPDGREKTWGANRTSLKTLIEAWGPETSAWIGKRVVFELTKQNVRGQFKKVLYAKPYATPV